MIRMFSFCMRMALFLLVVFILPALASLAVWQADASRPDSWRSANWQSAGILSPASAQDEAVIYVFAARTGRIKGALSVHSWIVTKQEGEARYTRHDVVGWGRPVRKNAYAPDARWYSNRPEIIHEIRGKRAEILIPEIETAIAAYPYSDYGDYGIWPGPNSNSFVAYILNAVPELGLVLPANAVGRDFLGSGKFLLVDEDWRNVQVSLFGYAGFALGRRHGFELNFLGLVTGIGVSQPTLKLPGFGDVKS